MAFEEKIKEHEERRKKATAMGGAEKLKKRKASGHLNATERVDYLFDNETFRETGLFGTSYLDDIKDQTPRDGKICGFGQVAGRKVGAVAYDFTVKGSSSSYTNNKKMSHVKTMVMIVVFFSAYTFGQWFLYAHINSPTTNYSMRQII